MLSFVIACHSVVDPLSYEPDLTDNSTPIAEEKIAQAITVGIDYWKSVQPSQMYQLYLDQLDFREPDCPRIFPAVQQSQGWNNDCETAEGWQYSGRSQFRYEQDVLVAGQQYAHWGYFISNLTIISPEQEFLLMEGYGDLRVSEAEKWFEIVGTFGRSGDEVSWLSEQVSLQLQKSVDLEQNIVNISGGVSYFEQFSAEILAFRFERLQLEVGETCRIFAGEIVIADVSGQRENWRLEPQDSCEICRETGACWDLSSLAQVEQW